MICRGNPYVAVILLVVLPATVLGGNFATEAVDTGFCDNTPDYRPGMGQFVNNSTYNDPNLAVGPPAGGGHHTQNNSKIVSLGGFGGHIVLAFDHDVLDDPANAFGVDAIVFSNAVWPTVDPNVHAIGQYHAGEPAVIEIMPELNGNSTPGDDPNERWYLVKGSSLGPNSVWTSKIWNPAGVYPTHPPFWYPNATHFPNRPDAYSSSGWELPVSYRIVQGVTAILVNPNFGDADPNNDSEEGFYGYAEYTPTLKLGDRDGDNDNAGNGDDAGMSPHLYYATPDNPLEVGITRGSGGGDGIDIKWAVDTQNDWQPANLTHFRYIRITNGVDYVFGVNDPNEAPLGEASPEISAVADARPLGDLDADQDVDVDDYGIFIDAWGSTPNEPNAWDPMADIDVDEEFDVDLADYGLFLRGLQLHNELAEPNDSTGHLDIRARIISGDFEPTPGYVVIRISGKHSGTDDGHRWFNGLRAISEIGGGLWVDPNDTAAVEIVQNVGTLAPGSPATGVQINTESDANAAEENWLAFGGAGQAVAYDKELDTWLHDPFTNFLDSPGPDGTESWHFTAAQSPNTVDDHVDMMHLVIRKKAGYDGTPVRLYIGGQWGLVGDAPDPTFSGLLTAEDANAEGDVKIGVLRIEPLRTLTLTVVNDDLGTILLDPDVPETPPYMYYEGTRVSLQAEPVSGESFKEWRVYDPNHPGDMNYVAIDSNSVLRLTMDADYEVDAAFECGSGTGCGSGVGPMLLVCGVVAMLRRR